MTLVSIILTSILVFCATLILFSANSTPSLQKFYNSFNYIKFIIQVFGVWLGFLYFYKNQENQKTTHNKNLLQKKIDEGNDFLDNLSQLYIDISKKDITPIETKNLISMITLLGEKIFKFIETHSEIFSFSDDEVLKFQSIYSITSDNDTTRAFDKNKIFSLISETRVILWTKLKD